MICFSYQLSTPAHRYIILHVDDATYHPVPALSTVFSLTPPPKANPLGAYAPPFFEIIRKLDVGTFASLAVLRCAQREQVVTSRQACHPVSRCQSEGSTAIPLLRVRLAAIPNEAVHLQVRMKYQVKTTVY